jgi:hypothetical protein
MQLKREGKTEREIALAFGKYPGFFARWYYTSSKPLQPKKGLMPKTLELKRDCKWIGRDVDFIEIPLVFDPSKYRGKYRNVTQYRRFDAETWLRFLGWWLAEGSINHTKGGYRIDIITPHKNEQEEVVELIKKLGFKPMICKSRVEFFSKQIFQYLKQFGHAETKFIPTEIKDLSPRLLRALLESLFKGDGCDWNKVNARYCTVSKRLAEDVAEIALKCGFAVSIRYVKPKKAPVIKGRSVQSKPFFQIYLSKTWKTPVMYKEPKKVPYKGFVYCVTVPNHIIFVERNGKTCWCGNSRVSRAGLTWLLLEQKPRLLLLDEIDKVADRECLAVLLSLMETGLVVETLHKRSRVEKLETIVVGAANDVSELPGELLSRFVVLKFKPYKWSEFLQVAKNVLVKREKVNQKIARYIAFCVWNKLGSKDFRDCQKLARMVKHKQSRREVNAIVKTLTKYR